MRYFTVLSHFVSLLVPDVEKCILSSTITTMLGDITPQRTTNVGLHVDSVSKMLKVDSIVWSNTRIIQRRQNLNAGRRSETLLMTTAISSGELVACCYLRQWGYVFNACLRVCVTSITQKRMEAFGWHFARWYHLGQGRTDLTFGVPRRILPMWEIIPFRWIRLTILLNTAAKREHRRSVGLATAGALAEVCTLWALSSSLCCACVTFKKHDGGKVIDFGTKNRLDHADKCRSCHTRVK